MDPASVNGSSPALTVHMCREQDQVADSVEDEGITCTHLKTITLAQIKGVLWAQPFPAEGGDMSKSRVTQLTGGAPKYAG